jgi:hypothetical protein
MPSKVRTPTRPGRTSLQFDRMALESAIERLRTAIDREEVDLLERVALGIVDLLEKAEGLHAALSASLEWSHQQHIEIIQLRKRTACLVDERRRHGRAAA